MEHQHGFAELEYQNKKRQTRRDVFLDKLERLTPWEKLVAVIEPHYPKGARGRPPIGVERMLRMYLVQQCLGLSDEGIEDAVYDSQSVRRFVGIDLARETAPDATTVLKFRRLLEQHNLTKGIFAAISAHLDEQGLLLRTGTIVDATLIAAPPSTKNKEKARDSEMHQSKKGNQWYFGMKAHIGVDAVSGLVHTVIGTAGNVSDISQANDLLHGEEEIALGDAGYTGIAHRPESQEKPVTWVVAAKRSTIKQMPEGMEREQAIADETSKAQLRAIVEHPFHVLKNLFKHRKTRYRGLAKNTAQLFSLFGMVNLMLASRWLLGVPGARAS
jgi:IS5 family transposase